MCVHVRGKRKGGGGDITEMVCSVSIGGEHYSNPCYAHKLVRNTHRTSDWKSLIGVIE